MEWIECNQQMPPERQEGCGTVSERVQVELTDGRITTDWLINGRWVLHCKDNGAYPARWKWRDQ